jgi:hypothetical protein
LPPRYALIATAPFRDTHCTWIALGNVGIRGRLAAIMAADVLGYRYLAVDYSDDRFVYDMVQHGPLLGVVFDY